jgi:hypothetical protein
VTGGRPGDLVADDVVLTSSPCRPTSSSRPGGSATMGP